MSVPRYILALDQGTTSSRALVFDHAGEIVGSAQREFAQIYPQPGWVEHDPEVIWESQCAVATEALAAAKIGASELVAVGVANQRETTVVWDRETGRPVANAIVWQDRRTADFCARLRKDGVEPLVTARTGLRLDPYFSGTKLRWILDHVDGARARAVAGKLCFGTIDSWLLWRLTGGKVHATDVSNASRTLLLNLHTGAWDEDMLNLFGVPRAMLPEVRDTSGVFGKVAAGLPGAGAPIAGMAGDQQAALFGQACFTAGMAKNTYGTGCFLLMHTGDRPVASKNNLLTTIAWRIGGRTDYALEGSVFAAGAVVQWLRDELCMVRDARELDELAASVLDAGGMYLVPAFAGLGAPHWDPHARGTAVGMTRGTNRAHFCRAALEAIAYQSADLVAGMERDGGIALKELRVDGGVSRSRPLLRFQADLLGVPVVRPKNVETTALGAAYLAGLATGFWSSREDIARHWKVDTTFKPERAPAEMASCRADWARALVRAKNWARPDE